MDNQSFDKFTKLFATRVTRKGAAKGAVAIAAIAALKPLGVLAGDYERCNKAGDQCDANYRGCCQNLGCTDSYSENPNQCCVPDDQTCNREGDLCCTDGSACQPSPYDSYTLTCQPTCILATCEGKGFVCGEHPDGCDGTIECGDCSYGEKCNDNGICKPVDACEGNDCPCGCEAGKCLECEICLESACQCGCNSETVACFSNCVGYDGTCGTANDTGCPNGEACSDPVSGICHRTGDNAACFAKCDRKKGKAKKQCKKICKRKNQAAPKRTSARKNKVVRNAKSAK